MKKTILFVFFVAIFSIVFAQANKDVIILKNGDKISGEIINWSDNTLVVAGTMLGEVKVPWENVLALESTRQLFFRLDDHNIFSGIPQGVENGQQVLNSSVAGRVLVAREKIIMAGPSNESVNPEHIKLQEELNKTKEDLANATEINKVWSGYLNLNFSGSSGNSDSVTFVSIAHLERNAYSDKFTAHLEARFGKTDDEKSAEQITGYLRENVDITKRLYIYGRLEGKWDAINEIDFGFMAELGGGVHILKEGDFSLFEGDKVTLDFDLGATYTAIDYENDEDTHSAGAVARIAYKHIFANKWTLTMTGTYIQDFREPKNKRNADSLDGYRCIFEMMLEMPVTTVLSLTTSIKDEYNNAPATGRERNDFYWLVGLKVNL